MWYATSDIFLSSENVMIHSRLSPVISHSLLALIASKRLWGTSCVYNRPPEQHIFQLKVIRIIVIICDFNTLHAVMVDS